MLSIIPYVIEIIKNSFSQDEKDSERLGSIGSKSFAKVPFILNELCTTGFKQMNF